MHIIYASVLYFFCFLVQMTDGLVVGQVKDHVNEFVYDFSYWSLDSSAANYTSQEQVNYNYAGEIDLPWVCCVVCLTLLASFFLLHLSLTYMYTHGYTVLCHMDVHASLPPLKWCKNTQH